MEVTFNGTYDKQMFIEALRLTERESMGIKIFRYLALGLALFVIGGTIYAWSIGELNQSDIARVIRNVVTASIIGYYYFSPIINRRRLLANLFSGRTERTMQGSASFEGIAIGPLEGRKLFKWEQFTSRGGQGNIYALLTVDGSVAVFHKDFFATESDWQRFKQMASQKVIVPK